MQIYIYVYVHACIGVFQIRRQRPCLNFIVYRYPTVEGGAGREVENERDLRGGQKRIVYKYIWRLEARRLMH